MAHSSLYLLGHPPHRISVSLEPGQSVSAALTASPLDGELRSRLNLPATVPAVRVATILAALNLTALPYRYVLFVPHSASSAALGELETLVSRTATPAAPAAAALVVPAAPAGDPENRGLMFFLDAAQFAHLRRTTGLAAPQACILATGQRIEAPISGTAATGAPAFVPTPYLVQPLGPPAPPATTGTLQAYPLNELPPDLVSSRAQHVCFLHPGMRAGRRRTYISLSHPDDDAALSDLHLSISAVPVYTACVPLGRVGIHETLLKSIGVRPGEPVSYERTRTLVPRLESRVFSFRQAIARVGYSHSVDVGYAVARIPDRLLDVLGIEPGQTVIVQGLRVRGGTRARPARVQVRALPLREPDTDSPAFRNLRAELGVQDIETVGLDLLRRQDLAVEPGTPIIVRPALSSLLAQEVLPISLAFVTAIIGGVAQAQPIIVATVSVLFVAFVMLLLLRRFR
jgi:hypothetical protein